MRMVCSFVLCLALLACGGDETTTSSTGGSSSDASTSSDVGSGGSAPGSSSGAGSGGGSGSSSTSGGSDGIIQCTDPAPCGANQNCWPNNCCMHTGFCVDADGPSCGGIAGEACPDGLECVIESCTLDGLGVCLTPVLKAELLALQPDCWL